METTPFAGSGKLFGPSSQRALRLRANSDLRRANLRNRAPSVKQLPETCCQHEHHGLHLGQLLNEIDSCSGTRGLPITVIASENNLLLNQSPETLVEVFAQSLSWDDASYFFDSSTYLIEKLQAIYSSGPDASCAWYTSDANCQRLKNESFLANLIYLLLRLQTFLFQILVRKCRSQVESLAHYLNAFLELQRNLDKECVKEWPSGQRPLSTTWPWNIRPSLVVLWGVCWMFYPSQQDGRRNARSQGQPDASRFAFAEDWAENLPGPEPQPDARGSSTHATSAYRRPTQAELSRNETLRTGTGVAQHASQAIWPTSQPITGSEILAAFDTSDMYPQHMSTSGAVLPPSAYGPGAALYSPRSGSSQVPNTSWPDFHGGNTALSHVDAQRFSPNVWNTVYGEGIHQAQQYQGHTIPSLEVSPVTTSSFPAITYSTAPSRQQFFHSRRPSQAQDQFASSSMGEAQFFPLSPRSERQPSVPTSVASASSALMSPEHSSPASETSRRPRATIKRARSPPRNEAGQIYCDHHDCIGKNVTFKRPCEWNKHMDKHDRPYKCKEPGCETNPGFTYSGGLLRHQREVHRMHMSTRAPLFCPFKNCNRSSGTGFTRRENLEEHKRRRHLGESVDSPGAVPTSSSPASTTHSMPPPSVRKRRRMQDPSDAEAEDDDDDNEEDVEDEDDTSDSARQIKRLRDDIRHRDETIRQQQAQLEALERRLGVARPPPPQVPATRA